MIGTLHKPSNLLLAPSVGRKKVFKEEFEKLFKALNTRGVWVRPKGVFRIALAVCLSSKRACLSFLFNLETRLFKLSV